MDALEAAQYEKILPSCAECRRRKAKCDRLRPCGNCTRFGRDCSHESVTRTPLTRKHLTDVEQELARAKALLRQYGTTRSTATAGPDLDQDGIAPGQNVPENPATNEPLDQALSTLDPHAGYTSTQRPSTPVGANRISRQIQGGSSFARYSRPHSPVFSLETSPAGGEFDWDERVQNPSQSRFVDGMATLTERASRGYMGVASGAALLRLADSSGDNGAEPDDDPPDDANHIASAVPSAIFSSSQLEPFIDGYFQTYHVSYPIVHEATFRAQFMEVIPRPKTKAWQVLLHIVATLGSFCSSLTAPEIDVALFEATKARLSIDMLETGNLTLVQALTLMSNYVQKRNKPNSGYNYLGLAKRMAMGIGLHKEFPVWHSRPMWLEMRRRVYWCLYIFDVGATITFSRPLDLPQEGIEIQLPLNVADSDITASTQRLPTEVQEVTLYTHVRCQARFHLATSEIYSKLISAQFPSAKDMLQADDWHLVGWLRNLPACFQENALVTTRYHLCHSILQWRWRNFRILMYRPYLMRRFMAKRRSQDLSGSTSEDDAMQRCLTAAQESIHMIATYWQTGAQNVLANWYALYFLFQATLIPVICLRNEPHSNLASGWRNSVNAALESISDMTRINTAASRCYAVVMKLCGAYLAPDSAQWDSPTKESPLTQLNALNSFMWPMTDAQFSNAYDLAFLESVPTDFVNQFLM